MSRFLARASLLAAAAAAFLAGPALAGYKGHPLVPARPWDRAIITYDVSSDQGAGTEIRYIDGLKMRTEVRLKTGKDAPETVSVEISLPDYVYRYRVGDPAGEKVTNPQGPILARYKKLSKEEQAAFDRNADEFTEQVFGGFSSQGPKASKGTQVVAGHECEIFEVARLKTCLWRKGGNLPLKTSHGPSYMSEAKKVEIDPKISAKLFELPKDVEFKTDTGTEAMAEQVAGMMFEMIKRGGPPRMPGTPGGPTPPPNAPAPPSANQP